MFQPSQLTWLASAPFRAQHTAGIRPVITGPAPERGRTAARAFPLPFGRRHSLLGHPVPPGIPPLLRSAYRRTAGCRLRTMTGFPRFPHSRCDRIGCPLYPGTGGALTGRTGSRPAARRLSAARVLHPGPASPAGALANETSTRVHAIHPPGLPLARIPTVTRGPLRLLPWAPHPHGQDPCTHAREGTGFEH